MQNMKWNYVLITYQVDIFSENPVKEEIEQDNEGGSSIKSTISAQF